MRGRLPVPFAVSLRILVVLLVVAGGLLAASSAGGRSDDETASGTRQEAESPREGGREEEPDRRESPLMPLLPPLAQQPFVGIVLGEEGGVVVVEQVLPDGPAAEAGVHEGDLIEAVDGTPIRDPDDVAEIVRESEGGDVLTFQVSRDGDEQEIDVEVGLREALYEWPGLELGSLLPQLDDLLGSLSLPNLRERISEALKRFVEAEAAFLDEDGERVVVRVVAGTIAEVSDDGIEVSPNGGGSKEEFAVTEDTHILRGLRFADAADLEPGDQIVVVVWGKGREAWGILAIPASEE